MYLYYLISIDLESSCSCHSTTLQSLHPILYRDGMIYFKTGPVKIKIKGQKIIISFNVLPLGKDKAVLGMPFLQKFNPKINWITEIIKIKDT